MKSIREFNLKGKIVLIRCDFNVSLKNGKVTDATRIKKALNTIEYAIYSGAKVVLFSHLGRVEEDSDLKKNDLKVVKPILEQLLELPIKFSKYTRGEELERMVKNLREKEVLLVQNTRYEDLKGNKESSCDDELSRYWASLGDIFIDDAFGTIHRSHASNKGIAKYLPSGYGFLVFQEVEELNRLKDAKHPFTVVMGGSKVRGKIPVIEKLIEKCDYLIIGGKISFTFLKAEGYDIPDILVDAKNLDFSKKMLEQYPSKIVLPIDFKLFKNDKYLRDDYVYKINKDESPLDIGNNTIDLFLEIISKSETVFCNGPMGMFENAQASMGTKKVLEEISRVNHSVIGGGDTLAASKGESFEKEFTFVSTGGGATLEYLAGNIELQ